MRVWAGFGSWSFVALLWAGQGFGHDIPNARIDRSIQAELRPGGILVDYEVSLSELTLTQDLRALSSTPSVGDRGEWFGHYGELAGPLNARGLLLTVNGEPVEFSSRGYDLVIEDHPRYTFHFEAAIPPSGRLRLTDSNYAVAEGMSRLAIRGRDGVEISGDSLAPDVASIALRPAWQLSPDEESRSKRVVVEYRQGDARDKPLAHLPDPKRSPPAARSGLSSLLDRAGERSWIGLGLFTFVLGVAHSIQPGHGKALVMAGSIGPGGGRWRGASLGLAATFGHLASVSALAALFWLTGASNFLAWNTLILRATGFLLASVGLWRVGHHLGDFGHTNAVDAVAVNVSAPSLINIGLISGLIPCWDAVGLLMVATAIGRIGLGIFLLFAFSLGMTSVLVVVGLVASELRTRAIAPRWGRSLGLISGVLIAIMGGLFITT